MLGFLTIFVAGLAGFTGVGPWAIGAATIALASLSYAEHYDLYRRGREMGLTEVLTATVVRSAMNAGIAATVAYGGGILLRLI